MIKTIVLSVAAIVLFALSLHNARAIPSAPILHFSPPISGQVAYNTRANLTDRAYPIWPTFYYQSVGEIATDYGYVTADTIGFSGDFALVWPASFINGAAPSSIDTHGIAISYGLAHDLFGSDNVYGMAVEVDGNQRVIRGVFAGSAPLAILSYPIEDTSPAFTTAALHWPNHHPTIGEIQNLRLNPTFITLTGPSFVAGLMAWLPFAIVAMFMLVYLIRHIKSHQPKFIWPMAVGLLFVAALILPGLLENLPPWAVPTHFGDFQFWGNLVSDLHDDLRQFVSTPATLQNTNIRIALVKQGALLAVSLPITTALCLRLLRWSNQPV